MTLWLKQLTKTFPTDADETARKATVQRFGTATHSIESCAAADKIAAEQGAQLIENRAVALAGMPEGLQRVVLATPIGHATPPFGNLNEGARVMVVCDRH